MPKRIVAVGRISRGWVLWSRDSHPLPPSARRTLEKVWPRLEAEPMTPEECETWFERTFEPKEVGK